MAAGHRGWIGVDLDGTLAHYDEWKGAEHIGTPIAPMVERIRRWAAEGREVRIFTARVFAPSDDPQRIAEASQMKVLIEKWCFDNIGWVMPVTCTKDYGMVQLWDDRAVSVVPNSGMPCCDAHL